MKKNIVKMVLTTALVATAIIGSNKLEAKACELPFILDNGVCACHECFYNDTGLDAFAPENEETYLIWSGVRSGLSEAESEALYRETMNILNGIAYGESNMDIKSHNNLLNMANADRNANGAGDLAWNADLEVVARQRAYEVYLNAQSAEYVNALNSGDYAAQAAIVHNGSREGIRENAIVSLYSGVAEETANQNWIASNGHHVVRINAGYTQYACASYTDPVTGMETWVEVFQ